MGRTRHSEKSPRNNPNESTSARTRPFSFEEIMLRRKEKLASNAKNTFTELRESDGSRQNVKDLDAEAKKSSNRTDERIVKRERDHSVGKEKRNFALDSELKRKSTNNKSSGDRESREEKQGHHKTRTADQPSNQLEKITDKKRSKDALEKNRHEERGRVSKGEGKRKHHSRSNEKERPDTDLSIVKRRDSGKLKDTKHSDRNYQKKEHSQAYHEESRLKKKRSRSREYDREKDKSPSMSPRATRHSHHERDYGDPSSFKDKSRRKYHDDDKYRTSGNGGYSSGHQWKRGSGLGGYSPRKRRTEVAVDTPTVRSPERKNPKWDQPPAGNSNSHSGSLLASIQSSASKIQELVPPSPLTSSTIKPKSVPSIEIPSAGVNVSLDSVQLTQATRPIRRLYIENLPPSASEKTLVDYLNDFILSSDVNHIQGTKPCISCIVNKEKCQAVVEFLTPENATAALSFDGKSLFGTVLKIRRPKDFVEVATGIQQEQAQAAVKAISDVVEDSPNKIFIAGISKILSSDMLMEIVSAFGPLKAYHFEFKEELNGACAFLEYVEPCTTLKACAGLNGMKLGGNILTAVQATPHAHWEDITEGVPSYDIPEHVKPLLASPTKVLQLKNMLTQEELSLLSEPEVEETLEDIRLECARFGTVKSVNVVRNESSSTVIPRVAVQETNGESTRVESTKESHHSYTEQNDLIPASNTEECNDGREVEEDTNINDAKLIKDLEAKDNADDSTVQRELMEVASPQNAPDDNVSDKVEELSTERSVSEMSKSEVNAEPLDYIEDANPKSIINKTEVGDHQTQALKLFEAGCVLVEYVREEAACKAAHCLHGRSYGERVVVTGYVPHDLYLSQFDPKMKQDAAL
ncbi:hypothetical protein J5N97_023307 [Dioscorea zingiberensis]|uniref:RRM domain-containing protein n=1 Tax=Dioscorea zingiberensis TaxID=325984 RepID=A0A9D5CCW0_9LILI|nr:hypothetical protein J5N97_023307 [Dioscorea zingiberensis]